MPSISSLSLLYVVICCLYFHFFRSCTGCSLLLHSHRIISVVMFCI